MPERDPATMNWVDAFRLLNRAYLYIVNQDAVTGQRSTDARILLVNLASSIR